MKKIIATIFIIFVMLFTFGYFVMADTTGTVTADSLNIRKEASTSSSVVTRVSKGAKLNIVEDQGEWLKVTYKDYSGYVSSKFVEKAKVEENTVKKENIVEENTTTNDKSKRVATEKYSNKDGKLISDVKVYSLPLVNSVKLGEIKKDSGVLVINSANNWAYVQGNSVTGWIKLASLDIAQEETPTQVENKVEEQVVENKVEENVVENKVEEKPTNTTTTNTTTSTTTTPTTSSTYPRTMYANKEGVIIRTKPSKESEALNSLKKGEGITVTAKEGEWYKITLRGDTGYVFATLLSNTK